jgi:hypothetical protein
MLVVVVVVLANTGWCWYHCSSTIVLVVPAVAPTLHEAHDVDSADLLIQDPALAASSTRIRQNEMMRCAHEIEPASCRSSYVSNFGCHFHIGDSCLL